MAMAFTIKVAKTCSRAAATVVTMAGERIVAAGCQAVLPLLEPNSHSNALMFFAVVGVKRRRAEQVT